MSIPVVFEDSWLLVVNKPAGLLTIPTPKKEKRTLTQILNLYLCHRLDRNTSGLIIYAKSKSIQKKMMEMFKERKVKKTYIAYVQGDLRPRKGKINYSIGRKSACTRYEVMRGRRDFSIVKVYPKTGRKNQIRLHFKMIGHPIVGEDRFSFRRDFALRAKRLCLHAQNLEFYHPVTKRLISLRTESPTFKLVRRN
ncbi:MAG: RluA family pseudouridine synthase [Candidatus Omnitrophica bacterium]|nr:RluA family pseudouridine synthase [Candidatus Omnitrophota bacterium]